MKNVHPNAPVRVPLHYQRPTHKQSIAIQTATDHARHGLHYTHGFQFGQSDYRLTGILQTTRRNWRFDWSDYLIAEYVYYEDFNRRNPFRNLFQNNVLKGKPF